MRWKYETRNGSGEVQANSAEGAASKILMNEPIIYGGSGNYYIPPMVFYGAISKIKIKLSLIDKIIQSQGLLIVSPEELKGKRKWL